jgi:hypothetical protein
MTGTPSKTARLLAGLAAVLLVAACETTPLQPSDNFVGDMVVVTDYAQFFRLGPQQAGGADFSLRTGERVMLQRKEFGYSRVQLENGLVGYMANEDITAAPPEPRRKRGLQRNGARESGSSSGSRGRASSEEEFFDDIALPDPNLDIMPEEIPIEPLPELIPSSVDQPASVDRPQRVPTKIPAPDAAPAPVQQPLPETAPANTPPVSTST